MVVLSLVNVKVAPSANNEPHASTIVFNGREMVIQLPELK